MRSTVSLAICFLLLSAAAVHAEPTIAIFNVQKVASECEALQEARTALEKKFGAQKEALEKQRAGIEKRAASLKGKATAKQQADLNKMHREYTEKAQAFVRVFQADEMRIRRDIDTVINAAAKELAARKGYALIIDAAAAIHADAKFDITAEMLTATNEIWRKSKSASPEGESGGGAKDATGDAAGKGEAKDPKEGNDDAKAAKPGK